MISEIQMRAEFSGGYNSFSPLTIRLAESAGPQSSDAAATLEVIAEGQKYTFDAEFKSRSSPKAFADALRRIEQWESRNDRLPLLVLPYLREEQLDQLLERKLSGIDLCGNGVIAIPGKLYVYRTGAKNRFPDSAPSKYAYRGTTSLVARAFLCRADYDSLRDIEQEIRDRGGSVVVSTVSKALRRLEDDLIVDRQSSRIRLRQGDKLLDKLAEFDNPPKITRKQTFAIRDGDLTTLLQDLPPDAELALSGRSSVEQYAVIGREQTPVVYTTDISRLTQSWGGQVEETSRFIDFELQQTADPTVYFDRQPQNGLPFASPIQAFLECNRGDKRERETAQDVKKLILARLQSSRQ